MPRVEELIGGARFMTMLDLAPLEPFGYAHCSGEGNAYPMRRVASCPGWKSLLVGLGS